MARKHRKKTAGRTERRNPPRHVIAATEAQNQFGRVLDLAQSGPVVVEKFGRPTVVVVSNALYESLVPGDKAGTDLDALTARFDSMLAGMQSDRAAAAVDALFEASGAELGKAALKAARKRARAATRRKRATRG